MQLHHGGLWTGRRGGAAFMGKSIFQGMMRIFQSLHKGGYSCKPFDYL